MFAPDENGHWFETVIFRLIFGIKLAQIRA